MPQLLRTCTAVVAGSLGTAAVAAVLQAQVNLFEITRLGIAVPLLSRLAVSAEDLARFGPVMFAFALVAGVLALPLQALLRWARMGAVVGHVIASMAMLALVLYLLRSVIPLPAIAATRSLGGLCLMASTGLVGGLVTYALLHRQSGVASHSRRLQAGVLAAGLLLPGASFLLTQPTPQPTPVRATDYRVETVMRGLVRPWSIAPLADGRMLVTEMAGRLRLVEPSGRSADVSLAQVPAPYHRGRAIGLMEVALSPRFAQDQQIYLTMGYRTDAGVGVRLVRGRLEHLSIENVEVLFESTPKPSDGNNGGRIAFLDDNTLLLTVGDGSARREEAQNPENSLGKVMRISLPQPDGAARASARVHTSGHRNPQGIVRDPLSGAVYVSEHGPRGGDELNLLREGANYGWPVVSTGIDYPFARVSPFTRLEGFENPMLDWAPSIAPSGLAIYDGTLFPEWRGDFLVPALKERGIRQLVRRDGRVVEQKLLLAERGERIRDVRVGADGAVYVLTDGVEGALLRLVPTGSRQ